METESIWKGCTIKSLISGALLAVIMCAANSYLTLKAGVIEEGPIISALIFTGIFFSLKRTVTTEEAVIAATMGSAGGSFGFIANLFAAYQMVGIKLTTTQMFLFSLSTSAFSILMAIPFYYLFVVKETLPWVVGQACADVIRNTVASKETFQAKVILWFTMLFFAVIMMQGMQWKWMPEETSFLTVGLVTIGLAWSPFAIGAGGLLGLRTGFGFLLGSVLLVCIAPHTDTPKTPHRFFWPGVSFLITSGLTVLLIKWRVMIDAIRSLKNIAGNTGEKAIIPLKWLVGLSLVSGAVIIFIMWKWFEVAVPIGLLFLVVGAMFLNMVATRAAGETTFNPARAMGIVLQGVGALAGGVNKLVNLTGAGMIAGGTSQTSILDQDLYTGWRLGVNPRLQTALQAIVLPVIALVSVGVFRFLSSMVEISMTNDALPAPVAKAWAGFAILLSGGKLPPNALNMLIIFGAAGVVVALLENFGSFKKYMPSTTGIGIGMILPITYSLDFFLGAIIFLLMAKRFKVLEETLSSLAAAGILGEAAGGMLKGAFQSMGIFPMP